MGRVLSLSLAMSNVESMMSAWDQAEQGRHAALLRQLKAEFQDYRRRTSPTRSAAPLPVSTEQPAQPDPGESRRVQLKTK